MGGMVLTSGRYPNLCQIVAIDYDAFLTK